MGNWTVRRVPIRAASEHLEMREDGYQGKAPVKLENCHFKQEVRDSSGKLVRVACAGNSGAKPCDRGGEDCKLKQWMESVKAFIRQIDVDAL